MAGSSGYAQTAQEVESARQKGMEYLKGEQYTTTAAGTSKVTKSNYLAVCDGSDRERRLGLRPIIDKAHRFVQKEMEDEKGTTISRSRFCSCRESGTATIVPRFATWPPD